MPRKPTLTQGPASQYAGPSEIIREFADHHGNGGLIMLRPSPLEDDVLHVELYRMDGVRVLLPQPTSAERHEIHDEAVAATDPADLNPDETIGDVSVFGRTLTPDETDAFARHLMCLASSARAAQHRHGRLTYGEES